ncbi:metallophosphoesterase [bacterium]|nr:metallophosphoesterase [bacterium]
MLKLVIKLLFGMTLFGMTALHAADTTIVTIVYTNNNNGNLEPCDCGEEPMGGLSRRKTMLDRLRAGNKNLLTVDAGDFFDAFGLAPEQDKKVIRLYESLGYDAVNIGDQEFANETTFVTDELLASRLPLVSSTLMLENKPVAVPAYRIKAVAGLRVAMIGYTPPSSFHYFPKEKKLEYQADANRFKSALEQSAPQSDVIIVLSQAGYDEDVELAKTYPQIDVIVGGHSQTEVREKVRIGKTIIVQAGAYGSYLGKLDLHIKDKRIGSFDNFLIPLDSKVKDDADFRKTIDQFLRKSKSSKSR